MKTLILKSNLVTAILITDLFCFEKSCELDFQIEPWSLFKNTIFWKTGAKVSFKPMVYLFVKKVWVLNSDIWKMLSGLCFM